MDYYLGDVILFALNYEPEGFMLCDGRILQITQNQALFALLGIQFGGNGSSTFALPDLRNASPINGVSYYMVTQGVYPMRS